MSRRIEYLKSQLASARKQIDKWTEREHEVKLLIRKERELQNYIQEIKEESDA